MRKGLIVAHLLTLVLVAAGLAGCNSNEDEASSEQVFEVKRGDLLISVTSDGNLVMPQAFDLHFGAPGDVKDVLVEEGDFVKAGTVLATLDNTAQRLDIMSANNNVQTVLSNLYETVPLLPQFPINGPDSGSGLGYPFYYPNRTALTSFGWAQDEVYRARELFHADNYTAAASELYIAFSDLEACTKIIEDAINNPQSGLGNTAPLVDDENTMYFMFQQYQSTTISYIVELRKVVDLVKQGQAEIEMVRGLTAQGKYEEAAPMFDTLLRRLGCIGRVVMNKVNRIKTRNYATIYGEDICLYLYGAADDRLNEALIALEKDGIDSPEFNNNLRIAQHEMALCNGILGTNEYVLQHGLSLEAEQGYKVDLENAVVTLENKKDDLLKTIIVAPFDGTVVSVGIKKNDVLSAQDYSSGGAIQLVDTTAIKFQGLVDEIDILKVKRGQKAMISVDAVPDKEFAGTVSFISPYGTTETSSVVKFAVTIQLDPTDVELKGGLTATADIAIYDVQNVLLVPLSAVTTTPEGSFVTIVNEVTGQQEKRQVVLGKQNFQFAEVLAGLKEGDQVIIEEKGAGAPVTTGFPQHREGPPGR
ncbi:MAG: efflux RND transporter periplasmic adaptor subunit [Chloroflexi bacterium]|nr:efflux RND transporter periplasmic adaptor subunit [Chloroflexota bacterium]